MFELTLCLDASRQKYICEFYKRIEKDVKKSGGIIVKQNTGGKCYLAMAVGDPQKEYLKSVVLEFVLKIVVEDYKYNFFKDNIRVVSSSVVSDALLMAISIFDADIDKEIVSSLIEFNGEIIIESFYYFKLQALKEKWHRTVSIINNNGIMNSERSMLEILKYLCAVSENNSVLVNLMFNNGKIELKNYYSEKKFDCNHKGISNLYSEIIKLNPMKINIKLEENEPNFENITNMLSCVFEDKIYFN